MERVQAAIDAITCAQWIFASLMDGWCWPDPRMTTNEDDMWMQYDAVWCVFSNNHSTVAVSRHLRSMAKFFAWRLSPLCHPSHLSNHLPSKKETKHHEYSAKPPFWWPQNNSSLRFALGISCGCWCFVNTQFWEPPSEPHLQDPWSWKCPPSNTARATHPSCPPWAAAASSSWGWARLSRFPKAVREPEKDSWYTSVEFHMDNGDVCFLNGQRKCCVLFKLDWTLKPMGLSEQRESIRFVG